MHKMIAGHKTSEEHRTCMMDYVARSRKMGTINSKLVEQFEAEKSYWIEVLRRVIAVIKFISSSGLAFKRSN
ncbi:Uncharacterized protein APZ42_008772 [Daphnia magna]|uniref:Uncharacterized protein n=1 Tax=Daphnia magna TaxID=35525 RepID=A0A164EFG8_9CRUS|nr:Uncharacterized protein APZ42_008772 [Daphnia magna]